MSRVLRIIPPRGIAGKGSFSLTAEKIFFLGDDEALSWLQPSGLNNRLAGLGPLFDQELLSLRNNLIEALARLNRANNSFSWWGGQLASKSSSSLPLVRLAVYYFCGLKLLEGSSGQVVFVVESPALAHMLGAAARRQGWQVKISFPPERVAELLTFMRGQFIRVRQTAVFFVKAFIRRAQARAFRSSGNPFEGKENRILLRSWVTEGNFDSQGNVNERIFGTLVEWLTKQGYAVYYCPMFFNIKRPLTQVYGSLFNSWQGCCLIPEHYLKWSDYVKVIADAWRWAASDDLTFRVLEEDLGPLLREVTAAFPVDSALCGLNLDGLMLKCLSARGIVFERIIYPFECNAPENQFILSLRQWCPGTRVIGYQHTTFFANQFAYHLARDEWQYHPLPDKIICSGRKYRKLLEAAGFPGGLLVDGPNLRFSSVYQGDVHETRDRMAMPPAVLVALTYSYSMAADVLAKVALALKGTGVKVYIRSHPLLAKSALERLIVMSGLVDYQFADSGTLQVWLSKVKAMITTGASITTLEAVAAGVPVIRVVPDAVIHYDALHEPEYPLACVHNADEIRVQYERADELLTTGPGLFEKFGVLVRQEYFTKPCEELFRTFIEC
ncbi:MAG: hypothetical protein HQL22_04385 [Candidatus Omnitrophica bacterium]|nr:hypothetical protein [Candidatus Omnitrophota bacterium]